MGSRRLLTAYTIVLLLAALAVRLMAQAMHSANADVIGALIFLVVAVWAGIVVFQQCRLRLGKAVQKSTLSGLRLLLAVINAAGGGIALGRISLSPPTVLANVEGITTGAVVSGIVTWMVLLIIDWRGECTRHRSSPT